MSEVIKRNGGVTMNKDKVIAAQNKYIDELKARIKRLRAKIAADREYQMKQVFH